MKKRTEIQVEVERELVVQAAAANVKAWCCQCRRRVRMILPEEAAAIAGISQRELFRRVEAGRVHFVETAEGRLFICPNSVLL